MKANLFQSIFQLVKTHGYDEVPVMALCVSGILTLDEVRSLYFVSGVDSRSGPTAWARLLVDAETTIKKIDKLSAETVLTKTERRHLLDISKMAKRHLAAIKCRLYPESEAA